MVALWFVRLRGRAMSMTLVGAIAISSAAILSRHRTLWLLLRA
jgi:hypothetical protein